MSAKKRESSNEDTEPFVTLRREEVERILLDYARAKYPNAQPRIVEVRGNTKGQPGRSRRMSSYWYKLCLCLHVNEEGP